MTHAALRDTRSDMETEVTDALRKAFTALGQYVAKQ